MDPEQLWKETYHNLFHQAVDPEERGYASATHWIYYGSNYYTYTWDRVIKWALSISLTATT